MAAGSVACGDEECRRLTERDGGSSDSALCRGIGATALLLMVRCACLRPDRSPSCGDCDLSAAPMGAEAALPLSAGLLLLLLLLLLLRDFAAPVPAVALSVPLSSGSAAPAVPSACIWMTASPPFLAKETRRFGVEAWAAPDSAAASEAAPAGGPVGVRGESAAKSLSFGTVVSSNCLTEPPGTVASA